jgi:hypothetical protein
LDARQDDIDRLKQQLEYRGSIDNISTITEEIDDGELDFFHYDLQENFVFVDHLGSWVQIPKKSNIQRNGWKKQLAVMTKNRLLLFNSEKDQQAALSIDIE